MRHLFTAFMGSFLLALAPVTAAVSPLAVDLPETAAWIGQRVPFTIELRARGSFSGSASFDLPQVPGTLIVKIGNPVVGSKQLDGENWVVQSHEFALFSQQVGTLEIASFPVRFERREGFTGAAEVVRAETPVLKFQIERPPGSEDINFLVTTDSLELSESWEPEPGPARVGTVFKRSIVQRAREIPGMALAPVPDAAPDGIRVYPGAAATNDKLARGEFLGERRETITYLIEKPGTIELPALTYQWWNPELEKLQSKTLPAVTFEVAAPAAVTSSGEVAPSGPPWEWLLASGVVIGLLAFRWRGIFAGLQRFWSVLNPPHQVAARRLLQACRQHDAMAAYEQWAAWRDTQPRGCSPDQDMASALADLQSHLFGVGEQGPWRGDDLARAFRKFNLPGKKIDTQRQRPALPPLNPPAA